MFVVTTAIVLEGQNSTSEQIQSASSYEMNGRCILNESCRYKQSMDEECELFISFDLYDEFHYVNSRRLCVTLSLAQARFRRRTFHVPNVMLMT